MIGARIFGNTCVSLFLLMFRDSAEVIINRSDTRMWFLTIITGVTTYHLASKRNFSNYFASKLVIQD